MASPAELRVGVVDPVSGIDPHGVREFASTMITRQVFEPLCELGPGGDPVPRLLRALPRHVPGTTATYVAEVRDDVRFSDGTPLVAELVAESLRRCRRLGPAAIISGRGSTLSIELPHPRASLPRDLASWYAAVVLERDGLLLGTGPYVVLPPEPDGTIRLRPNRERPGPLPRIVTVTFRAYASADGVGTSSLIRALETGEIDLTSSLSRDDVERLGHVRKRFAPASSTAVLWLNSQRLPDLRLRRAIVGAVDRHALGGGAGTVTSFVARGVVPPPLGRWYDKIRHDPRGARATLETIGRPRQPLRMALVWGPRRYLPDPESVARRLAAQLVAVGLEVAIEPTSSSEHFMQRWEAGDYDLLLGGWNADSTDPIELVAAFFGTPGIHGRDETSHGCNLSRWSDPTTDKLLAEAVSTGDPGRLDPVLAHVDAQALLVPLFHGAVVLAYGPRVRSIAIDDLGFPLLSDVDLGAR